MTTFTSEDRIEMEKVTEPSWYEKWGSWEADIKRGYDYSQTKIEYFFPLTEQIGLDLDYTNCLKRDNYTCSSLGTNGMTLAYTGASWSTITPQLTITPNNPVGELSIGGINVGIEKKPSWLQRRLYKLLGFNWKDK